VNHLIQAYIGGILAGWVIYLGISGLVSTIVSVTRIWHTRGRNGRSTRDDDPVVP
jgi:hypothetical protein